MRNLVLFFVGLLGLCICVVGEPSVDACAAISDCVQCSQTVGCAFCGDEDTSHIAGWIFKQRGLKDDLGEPLHRHTADSGGNALLLQQQRNAASNKLLQRRDKHVAMLTD